mgnify:CR=1 FL=1
MAGHSWYALGTAMRSIFTGAGQRPCSASTSTPSSLSAGTLRRHTRRRSAGCGRAGVRLKSVQQFGGVERSTLEPPTCRWVPDGAYSCFLSHYKIETASDARIMHDMLAKMLRYPVFLDSANLADLRTLFSNGVHVSSVLVLLGTRTGISRGATTPCAAASLLLAPPPTSNQPLSPRPPLRA